MARVHSRCDKYAAAGYRIPRQDRLLPQSGHRRVAESPACSLAPGPHSPPMPHSLFHWEAQNLCPAHAGAQCERPPLPERRLPFAAEIFAGQPHSLKNFPLRSGFAKLEQSGAETCSFLSPLCDIRSITSDKIFPCDKANSASQLLARSTPADLNV